MRNIVAALILAWCSIARADDKSDLEKLVRGQLGALDSQEKLEATFASSSHIVEAVHAPDSFRGGGDNAIFHSVQANPAFKVGQISVTVLGDVAWFHGVGTFTLTNPDVKGSETRTTRVNGVAIKTGGSWRVKGELIAIAVDDKALFDDAKKERKQYSIPKTTTYEGDQAVARVVGGWLSGGLAKAAGSSAQIIASGTAPAEHKTGASTSALTSAWDRIKLVPARVHAELVKPNLAFVTADVAFALPKTATAHIILGAVIVKDKDSWRWVSINWSPAVWNPKPEFHDKSGDY